jgi:DNA-directed RNA polymerase subunit L
MLNIGRIKLRIESVSKVRIQIEEEEITLLNVLYIPGLGTNLLSRGALYKADLYRSFDKGAIYIRADNSSLVLKAIKRDSIYIIN